MPMVPEAKVWALCEGGFAVGVAGLADDGDELVGVEGCAADERAVYVGLGDELGDVVGTDAAAVLDADFVGDGIAVESAHKPAYAASYAVSAFAGGGATGADSPDRFVGNHDMRCLLRRKVCQALLHLAENHLFSLTCLVLFKAFTDTNYRT